MHRLKTYPVDIYSGSPHENRCFLDSLSFSQRGKPCTCAPNTPSENNRTVHRTWVLPTVHMYTYPATVLLLFRAYPLVAFFLSEHRSSPFSFSMHLSSFAMADRPVCLLPTQLTGWSVCDLKLKSGRLIFF